MKQVLRTIVLAKMQEASEADSPNWLRLLDFVEIAINNAPIADTELSQFYLNLGYNPQFFFDITDLFRTLYHERARAEEMGNRKKANYKFKVGQDILINQRKHHLNQLGRVVAPTPKAVGPFKIKRQITQNTFEIDFPAAMLPVFH